MFNALDIGSYTGIVSAQNETGLIDVLQNEKFTIMEQFVMKLMKLILPPQRDNDKAFEYLNNEVGVTIKNIEWVAVRPDTLIDMENISEYSVHQSTIRSPIFNAGKTSRINVADFMVRLIKDENLWGKWKYKSPVIYNK